MADEPVLIKKYGNRRLYDTSNSRYISLEQLADIIKQGRRVRVVESPGGRDITRQVLAQVILESQARLELLPVELLHLVIRAQGTLEQAPLAAFLEAATGRFLEAGATWARQFAELFGIGGASPVGDTEGQPPADDELRRRLERLVDSLSRKSH